MYCIIMAGGSGTRFWPRSRELRAKQFLPIIGEKSLIETTVDRFRPIVEENNIYIITKKSQQPLFSILELNIPSQNILFEPIGKDTAPCIGLAAIHVSDRDPDGIMVVSPADHLVQEEKLFHRTILAASELAERTRGIVTIGIIPDRPATGYGYIQIENVCGAIREIETCRVKTFAEKPDLETAKSFLSSGDFFWNSGIFVFRASTYLTLLDEFQPDIYEGLMEIREHMHQADYEQILQRIYMQIRGISVDFGIMEKATNVFMVKGSFPWNDLGSWEQVYKLSKKDENGNGFYGEVVSIDTQNTYVRSEKGLVALLGINNIVVVQEEDVTLICNMERIEDVKRIVERLRNKKLIQYL